MGGRSLTTGDSPRSIFATRTGGASSLSTLRKRLNPDVSRGGFLKLGPPPSETDLGRAPLLLYFAFVSAVPAPPEWVCQGNTHMNLTIEKVQQSQLRGDVPEFRPGDTVRVHVRLREAESEKGKEKEKERIQAFE